MVDYDERLYRVYAKGRELEPETLRFWLREFAALAPAERPLTVLDLGSGIGRFTPGLADTFGGPVHGVEPSDRMREIAATEAAHPAVSYLDGSAEGTPLPTDSCDLALLFLSFHHFRDQAAGLREVARVLRPGGVVLLRSQFADRMPDLHWYRYFPSAGQVDAAMYPTVQHARELAERAGLVADPGPVSLLPHGPRTLLASYERVRLRALSTFEHIPADELEAGFAEFARDAAARPEVEVAAVPAELLVLRLPG